jgi:hypothetical protein
MGGKGFSVIMLCVVQGEKCLAHFITMGQKKIDYES